MQTLRRPKVIPCRTDSTAFLLPDLQLCSFSQHSALRSALFLQSTFRSAVHSVPSVKHSALQSTLFLQSTFRSPVRSVPPVNIPLSSPLCSSSQHSPLQSALLRHIKPMHSQCHVSTNTDLLYTKPCSYFASLSLREPLVDPQSLHV